MTDISHLIRQSEFTKFQRCRRSHHFAYTHNVRPEYTGPRLPASSHRDSGTAAHKGAQVLHLGGTEAEARSAVTAFVDELRAIRWEGDLPELDKRLQPEWYDCHRMAQSMIGHYIEWLKEGNDAGFKTIMVEHAWEEEIPGTGGLKAYGQIDLAGHDALVGGPVVDDLKTGDFPLLLQVDFQLRTYAWAYWKITGDVPRQGAHRTIKRHHGGGNAKRPFVLRTPIHIDQTILEKHEKILAVRALDIRRIREYGLNAEHEELYPNPTKDCSWDCDFKAICPMVDEGDDWQHVLDRDFILKTELD